MLTTISRLPEALLLSQSQPTQGICACQERVFLGRVKSPHTQLTFWLADGLVRDEDAFFQLDKVAPSCRWTKPYASVQSMTTGLINLSLPPSAHSLRQHTTYKTLHSGPLSPCLSNNYNRNVQKHNRNTILLTHEKL